jgi:hypothetical protein
MKYCPDDGEFLLHAFREGANQIITPLPEIHQPKMMLESLIPRSLWDSIELREEDQVLPG